LTLVAPPVLERDADRVRHRQHLVRTQSDRAIRRDPAELAVHLHQRDTGAQCERDEPSQRLGIGHRGAARLAQRHEDLERLSTVVFVDAHEHRA
jgi:hypothetical protein